MLSVLTAIRRRLIGARDLIIDSAPILAWRRADPDAAVGHAPAQHPRPLVSRLSRPYPALSRLGLAALRISLSPANVHDAPFARPLLEWAVRLYPIRPRLIRLDAAGCQLAPHRLDSRHPACRRCRPLEPALASGTAPACHPPGPKTNWASAAPLNASLVASSSSFTRPRLPLCGWSTIARQVALTYTATLIVGLAAHSAGRPDLIRSPKRVLAHSWEAL